MWFKALWKVSDYIRKFISISPKPIKHLMCAVIALLIYYPLSRLAFILEKLGLNVENIPLSDYRNKPFYLCRNDALDRFGTRLEHRFLKSEIIEMMESAGFRDIEFNDPEPGWICVGYKI